MLNYYVFNDIFFHFYVSVPVSHTVLQVSELKNISTSHNVQLMMDWLYIILLIMLLTK